VNELPGEWVNSGVCAQVGGDQWFPDEGEPHKPAKRMCRACDVLAECREYALRTKQPDGIWAGMSPDERRKLWSEV
jgi:WhiB family redox-sensing transcriptional regulator